MRVFRALCVVAAVVCLCGRVALAQTSVNGSIRGYVRDPQQAVLPGAMITATSVAVPIVVAAISDKEGYYRLLGLPPGEYVVAAELSGFAKFSRPGIVVRAGLNLGVDIDMVLASQSELVTVKAETPLLESTKATQSTNIPGEYQRQVPLTTRRHWTSFLALAPGVVSTSMPGESNFYYLHGSPLDSHVSLIDGADVNPAAQSVPFSVNLSTEAIDDVQVQTTGVGAAMPLGVGLVINAATKSGSNQLRGTFAVNFEPSRWNDTNTPGGTSGKASILETDVAVGGRLRRDRAWIFGSYRLNRIEDGLSRTAAQLATLRTLIPGFAPFNRNNRSSFVFLKPNARLNARHQILASYRYDRNPLDGGSATDAAVFGRTRSGGHAALARLSSTWQQSLMTTVNLSYNTTSAPGELLRTDVPSRPVHRDAFLSAGRLRGSGVIATLDTATGFQEQPHHKLTLNADTVWTVGRAQRHDIQAGLYVQKVHLRNATHLTNGGFDLEELVLRSPSDPAQGTIPFHRRVFDQEIVTTRIVDATNWAIYGQDSWRPTNRLTIEAGFRVDAVRQHDQLFNVRLQRSVDVSPRTGVNYSLTANGRHALRAGWARRPDVMTYVSAGSNVVRSRDLYDSNLDGTFETVFVTPSSTTLLTDRRFDPDRHQPFVDESFANYSVQLPGNVSVDVGTLWRTFKDAIAMVESNGIYEGGQFRGYREPSLNDIYLVTNNRWNHSSYRAFQLHATKRSSTVQAIAGYTRQWRHINGTWQPNDPASFIQPDAFANNKGIGNPRGVASATEANSLSGTAMWEGGGSLQWQDHLVNASVAVRTWKGILGSVGYFFGSGPWSGPVVTRIAAADPRFGPATLVLPNGRLASNPLATTIRFAGATRGGRQFTLDALHLLNVSIGRVTTIGGRKLETSLRILNVLNAATDQLLLSGGNQTFSPNYQLAGQRQAPRAAQLQVRFLF